MKQREIRVDDTNWQCVQALSGVSGITNEKSKAVSDKPGTVEVVCTPSGGAQTIRLQLIPDWLDRVSDEELQSMIRRHASAR